jgi:hypothetical protein
MRVSDGNDLDELAECAEVIGVSGAKGQVHLGVDRCGHQVDGTRAHALR